MPQVLLLLVLLVLTTAQNLRSDTTVTASAKSDTKTTLMQYTWQYISYGVVFGCSIFLIVFMMFRQGVGVGVPGGDGPTGDSSPLLSTEVASGQELGVPLLQQHGCSREQ